MGNARILGTRIDNTVHEVAIDEYPVTATLYAGFFWYETD